MWKAENVTPVPVHLSQSEPERGQSGEQRTL